MLTRVDIANYRGFKSFRMEGLTRVSLLVGRNNSGKTALLESIHFLASGGDPSVLANVAQRRGELAPIGRDERPAIDFSHFFHKHEVRSGASFEIDGAGALPKVTVTAVSSDDLEPSGQLFDADESVRPALALRIDRGGAYAPEQRPLFLSDRGVLLTDPRRPMRRYPSEERREGPPIVFISPDSLMPAPLGLMWRQILRDKQELDVRRAMEILEKDLEDIVFEPGEVGFRSYAERAGILVSFKNDTRRVPLGSMGDGMRRLLALAISLIHAKEGYLLIDEIDTGFHYSIMPDMWRLVVNTANKSNIQVVATTHSWDCIEGLSLLCQQEAHLMSEVAVHKIDPRIQASVAFGGASVVRMVKSDIDPRQ